MHAETHVYMSSYKVGFEVLTAASMKMAVFWGVTLFSGTSLPLKHW
jgi:hypothetical protein